MFAIQIENFFQIEINRQFLQQFLSLKNILMRLFKQLKTLITSTDFFYSTEMLRYDDDLQYKTLTGGIISLGIIATIIVGFASMILNTLALNTFTTSTQIIKNPIPPSSVIQLSEKSSFRFGVQISGLNLSQTKRYFDVEFYLLHYSNGNVLNRTDFILQACTRQFFKDYPDMVKNFQQLKAGQWLCPSLNISMDLFGKYSSQAYNEQVIQVSACKNQTDPQRACASPQEISAYFLQHQNFLYFNVYFTNTQINPDKKNYKQYYIEDESYAIFGSQLGTQSFLYFTDYTVSTDYSIWPFSNIVNDIGCFVEGLTIHHPFQTTINGSFINFNFAKSSNSILYTRQVQKLSVIFSFMGGMIGAASAVLFVIKIYTRLSFEFSIAFEIFRKRAENQPENGGKQQKSEDKQQVKFQMNFFNFIKFYFYNFFKYLGCICPWPQLDYAEQCKSEILKQLDVKLLLKRIIFLEHCLTYLIDDFQLDALQLQKPQTPKQIKELRQKCDSLVDYQLSELQEMAEIKQKTKQKKTGIGFQIYDNPFVQSQLGSKSSHPFQTSKTFENGNNKAPKRQKTLITSFAGKQIIILDQGGLKQPQLPQQTITKSNQFGNKIKNIYKRQKVRESLLIELKNHAQAGNQVSSKIWKGLDVKIRNSLTNHNKSLHF